MPINIRLPTYGPRERQLPVQYGNKHIALKKAGELIQISMEGKSLKERKQTAKKLLGMCFKSDQNTESEFNTVEIDEELKDIVNQLKKNASHWHVEMTRSAHLLALMVFVSMEGENAFDKQGKINTNLFKEFCKRKGGITHEEYDQVVCTEYFNALHCQLTSEVVTVKFSDNIEALTISLKELDVLISGEDVLASPAVLRSSEEMLADPTVLISMMSYLPVNTFNALRVLSKTINGTFNDPHSPYQQKLNPLFHARSFGRRIRHILSYSDKEKVLRHISVFIGQIKASGLTYRGREIFFTALYRSCWVDIEQAPSLNFSFQWQSSFSKREDLVKKEKAFLAITMFISLALIEKEGKGSVLFGGLVNALLIKAAGRYDGGCIINEVMLKGILERANITFEPKHWEYVRRLMVFPVSIRGSGIYKICLPFLGEDVHVKVQTKALNKQENASFQFYQKKIADFILLRKAALSEPIQHGQSEKLFNQLKEDVQEDIKENELNCQLIKRAVEIYMADKFEHLDSTEKAMLDEILKLAEEGEEIAYFKKIDEEDRKYLIASDNDPRQYS